MLIVIKNHIGKVLLIYNFELYKTKTFKLQIWALVMHLENLPQILIIFPYTNKEREFKLPLLYNNYS
jgi:hypothetical protein